VCTSCLGRLLAPKEWLRNGTSANRKIFTAVPSPGDVIDKFLLLPVASGDLENAEILNDYLRLSSDRGRSRCDSVDTVLDYSRPANCWIRVLQLFVRVIDDVQKCVRLSVGSHR